MTCQTPMTSEGPCAVHDDVIKWKHFPCNRPFVQGIHRSPVNSPHKGQWRGALIFSLICVWINDWVNNREAGDLRHYRAHYDVTVMVLQIHWPRNRCTDSSSHMVSRGWWEYLYLENWCLFWNRALELTYNQSWCIIVQHIIQCEVLNWLALNGAMAVMDGCVLMYGCKHHASYITWENEGAAIQEMIFLTMEINPGCAKAFFKIVMVILNYITWSKKGYSKPLLCNIC